MQIIPKSIQSIEITSSSNSYLSFCFIASFPLFYKGTGQSPCPLCRAGVYSRRYFNLNRLLRREQAPALRCNLIITQIGRENNISADIYMCIRRGDLRSPAGEHSSPLPCSENILMRTLLTCSFYFSLKKGLSKAPLNTRISKRSPTSVRS